MNWEEKFDDMFPKIMGKYKVKGFPRGAFYEIKDLIRGELNAFSKPDVSQECEWYCVGCSFNSHLCCEHNCKPLKEKECGCECHKPGWGGEKHLGYYQDTCPCQPPSPIKGEHQSWILDIPSPTFTPLMKQRMTSPQPQSDWEKDFENTYHLVFGNIYHKPAIKAYISDLLKSQRESYQQEIVGKIKKQIDELPTIKHNTLEWVDKEVLLDFLAILEQEKSK